MPIATARAIFIRALDCGQCVKLLPNLMFTSLISFPQKWKRGPPTALKIVTTRNQTAHFVWTCCVCLTVGLHRAIDVWFAHFRPPVTLKATYRSRTDKLTRNCYHLSLLCNSNSVVRYLNVKVLRRCLRHLVQLVQLVTKGHPSPPHCPAPHWWIWTVLLAKLIRNLRDETHLPTIHVWQYIFR